MRELEARDQDYLFKLRLTAKVKRYIELRFFGGAWSCRAGPSKAR